MDDLVHYFASSEDAADVACDGNEYSSTHPGSSMYGVTPLMRDDISSYVDPNLSQLTYGHPNNIDYEYPFFFQSNISFGNSMPRQLPPEVEIGNIEYKRTLVNPTPDRFEHLVTQMKWRLTAGRGSAIYRLGVNDNGFVSGLPQKELAKSVQTLRRMARRLNATLHPLRECVISVQLSDQNATSQVVTEKERKAVEFMVCQSPSINDGKLNICVAILGGMDAGKSTLIGVLTDGELDNGHGQARLNLFRHLHEVQSGRTSSSTCEHLGFDSKGQVTNYSRATTTGSLTRHNIDEVLRTSSRLITLLDLAGHYKYQRTTLSGLARSQPVGALLIISAVTGPTTISLQHAQLAFSLNLPLAVVITKVDRLTNGGTLSRNHRIGDICSNILQQLSRVKAMAGSLSPAGSGVNHWSKFSLDNVEICAKSYASTRSAILRRGEDRPLFFPVSSVSGFGIDRLLRFLSRLGQIPLRHGEQEDNAAEAGGLLNEKPACAPSVNPQEAKFLATLDQRLQATFGRQSNSCPRLPPPPPQQEVQPSPPSYSCFWVNQVFTRVPGVPNPILFGTLQAGQLTLGQQVWLGPDHVSNSLGPLLLDRSVQLAVGFYFLTRPGGRFLIELRKPVINDWRS